MSDDTNERNSRVLALAQLILGVGNALDKEDFIAVSRLCKEAGRQARVLALMDKHSEHT